jgi:import inner membrane translocase subunit TIM21
VQRQQIPHQIYKDNNGVEHVRVGVGLTQLPHCVRNMQRPCRPNFTLLLCCYGCRCVVQLQFNMRGPGGVAIVSADMYKDSSGSWDYVYLLVDVQSGRSPPQRLNIVPPKLATVS